MSQQLDGFHEVIHLLRHVEWVRRFRGIRVASVLVFESDATGVVE